LSELDKRWQAACSKFGYLQEESLLKVFGEDDPLRRDGCKGLPIPFYILPHSSLFLIAVVDTLLANLIACLQS
jgi:hypothetical protein